MQKYLMGFLAAVLCVGLLSGCNEDAKLAKLTPPEADKLAREFITALQKKDTAAAAKLIEPKMREQAAPKVKNIADLMAAENAKGMKVIGVRTQTVKEERMVQINYQIEYPSKWVLATMAILESPKDRFVVSVRMDPLKQPIEKLYGFKLFGKSLLHYIVLLLTIAVPLFTLYVLIGCLRSPLDLKWKLLWLPFILVAFVTLHLDWTSGRAFLRLLGFVIFGASVFKQKYTPYILTVGVPVGALVFFIKFMLPKKNSQPAASYAA